MDYYYGKNGGWGSGFLRNFRVSLYVSPAPVATFVPTSCTIVAEPPSVILGESSVISWTTSYATDATLNGAPVAPEDLVSGSLTTPALNVATPYSMSVSGPGSSASCNVNVGVIIPPTGGLVPCGRLMDNPATGDIDESKPCSLCAMFYMLKNAINFILTLTIGIGVFILVIAGLRYATAAGDTRKIDMAKSAVTSVIIGIAIIFAAWLIIAVILQGMGYANMTTWNQVNCML